MNVNGSVFQQTGFAAPSQMSRRDVARGEFVQDLTTQARRSVEVFALLVGARAFRGTQPSLLDQSSQASRLDAPVFAYLPQTSSQMPHHLPLLNSVRQLVEDERINAARALLAREAPTTLRTGDLATWSRILAEPRAVPAADHGRDRTAEYDWLAKYALDYRGEWVAIAGGELVAHARTLRELLGAVSDLRLVSKPLVHKIR
ncbi:MAG TPA: DUF5678 domain-containing protein [Thermoanaerobaculia bacterium]|nr:DUF5678 domain-containing protein [Thermoanaerobaculia bacterium]